jgi:hypothetical protein
MHCGLLPNGRVFFLDKVENYTQLKLPDGQYAYSSEYDPETNTVVPLSYKVSHVKSLYYYATFLTVSRQMLSVPEELTSQTAGL